MTKSASRYDQAVAFLRNLDADWARLIDLVGPCLHDPKAAREPYEALIRAIAYQQLTAKAGDAIIGRLKTLFKDAPFPTAANLIEADFEALRGCGFSATKIATIKAIAEGSLSGLIPSRAEALLIDDESLIARIVTIKGIGRWTVEMLLMYSLERLDVLPVDNFGVREGYRALKSLSAPLKPKELHKIGKGWAPHRTVASWYLWRAPREHAGSKMRSCKLPSLKRNQGVKKSAPRNCSSTRKARPVRFASNKRGGRLLDLRPPTEQRCLSP
jgi:DNA-3-methyladenine glycosylase II